MPTRQPPGQHAAPVGFKDHFSPQATQYARFRPEYPAALFSYLARIAPARQRAWDCATGNGQAARGLAAHFSHVIATDASARQIANVAAMPNVRFAVARAEASGLAPASADLVTVAQALHWLAREAFYAEVERVLRPGGVLAVWSYGLLSVTPEIDAIISDLYRRRLGPFWPPERAAVESGYRDLDFPFAAITAPAFDMQARWTLDQLLGYIGTWSAVQGYRRALGEDPVAAAAEQISGAWGESASLRTVRWPLSLRLGAMRADNALRRSAPV